MKLIDPAAFKKFETQFKFNPKIDEKIAFTKVSDMLKTVDKAAGQLVEGASANTSNLGRVEPKQEVEKFKPDTQVAIANIQSIFQKPGISIAICGEDHSYKYGVPQTPQPHPVLQAAQTEVEQWNAKNPMQPFTVKGYYKGDNPDYWRNDLKPKIKEFTAKQESHLQNLRQHASSVKDQSRANTLIRLADGGVQIAPDVIILERGMTYNTSGNSQKFVKEEDLIGTALSIKQRSAIIATYLFLCAAGGDRGANFHVLIFFGEEHKDIFDCFEQLAENSETLPWVKAIKRNYGLLPSHYVKPSQPTVQ